ALTAHFKKYITYSDTSNKIFEFFRKRRLLFNEDLIDLRQNSTFLQKLPASLKDSYFKEMEEIADKLIPSDLRPKEDDETLKNAVIKIIKETLHRFIKAFSLDSQNSLSKSTTIEQAHLNAFVHPCLERALVPIPI
ncbi:7239_t:CDS:2, partial [Gigaspora rosea]